MLRHVAELKLSLLLLSQIENVAETGSKQLKMANKTIHSVGVAKKGGLETKFEETAGQMTVGHIRSYKFVRFGLKGF